MPKVFVLLQETTEEYDTVGYHSSFSKAAAAADKIDAFVGLHSMLETFHIEEYWLDGGPTPEEQAEMLLTNEKPILVTWRADAQKKPLDWVINMTRSI